LQDCRIGRTGAQRVDDDALADQFTRHRLGKRNHAALAGRIDRLARGANPARVRSDVHHPAEAARRHALHHDVADVQWAIEIDGDNFLPELRIGIEEIRSAIPAGIVDQERRRPRRRLKCIDGALHRVVVRDVGGMKADLAALGPDLARDLLAARGIQIEDADHATFVRQPPRDRRADAVGAAGEQNGLVFQSPHRCFHLLRFPRQHARRLVSDDQLSILILDVDLRGDDAAIAL
jgi:hypothetical protein